MRQRSVLFVLTAAIGVFALNACGSDRENQSRAKLKDFGSARVEIPLVMSEITSVKVVVSGAGISPDIDATIALRHGKASGVITQIPAGAGRTFTVNAYRNVELVCTGSALATVTAGARVQVVVTLQCTPDPEDLGEAEVDGTFNFQPRIDSAVASTGNALRGEDVSLTTTSSDPDGDPLTYGWTATGGSFSATDTADTTWTAPATTGTYTLTITVSDDRGGSTSLDVDVDVVSAAIDFDGVDDWVSLPTMPSASALTIEAWLDWTPSGEQTIVYTTCGGFVGNATSSQFGIQTHPNCLGTTSRYHGSIAMPALPSGWFHLALVVDATHNAEIFVDGSSIGTASLSFDGGMGATFAGGIAGKNDSGVSPHFPATMRVERVRVSDAARYTSGFTPDTELAADGDTVMLYTLEEWGETTISDTSGNGLDGTLSGGTWVEDGP